MSIIIPKNWRKGLGTQIVALCAIVSSKYKTVKFFEETEEYKNFLFFNSYYNLNLDIILVDEKSPDDIEIEFDDLTKIYVPYFKKDTDFSNNKHICIAMYQDSSQILYDKNNTEFPFNKLYTIDQYAKIFKFVKQAGYDIITIDSKDIPVKDKIDMLSRCCAVIGYEGGLAHLAHTLNIPVIMLPWKYGNPDKFIQMQLLHLDKKTYFLKTLKELLSYEPWQLVNIVNTLHKNRGNNLLFKTGVSEDILKRIPISKTEQILFPEERKLGG